MLLLSFNPSIFVCVELDKPLNSDPHMLQPDIYVDQATNHHV